ncbi:MAG: tRNA uracil 4-sulfurtransferase ThiI [Clostridia bacterium]|nr:tRNA uracil 4-sulfurtransferase ThiI [Clostridia bacterium]
MNEVILLKLGEIVLKGQNRRAFEESLLKTIRRRIAPKGEYKVSISQSTIYVEPQRDDCDLDEAEEKISKIFGVVAYSRACIVEKDLEAIQKAAVEYLADELNAARVFKVESKRADKKFPYKSPEISGEVGGYILENYPHIAVDVHKPDVTVRVEVREKGAYIHSDPKPGAGGIPVGTGGKAAILISGGIDSPVAAWMMARRGVELTAIHFASPPYTSERALDKVERLLKKVSEYCGRIKMYIVNFTEIQEQIRDFCPEELSTVIMRRFMMRVSEKIAREEECHALITGESLGQVASQTMQAIECTDACAGLPVFRPLIGTDKSEIVKIAQNIDTFETSIEPFEDCCTVFTPRHPRTKPTLNLLMGAEKNLDVEALVQKCMDTLEVKYIDYRK